MTAAYDMSMTVNATGDSVRITFPDFSNFEEVTVPESRRLISSRQKRQRLAALSFLRKGKGGLEGKASRFFPS